MRIVATKSNLTITLNLAGKYYSKKFESPEKAREVYGLILQAKEQPTKIRIEKLENEFSPGKQVVEGGTFEKLNGNYYLTGYNIPMPLSLVERIIEFKKEGHPILALVNFWKNCMLNPDERARQDLFEFASHYGFPITDRGYCMAYKAVNSSTGDTELAEFVSKIYLNLKKAKKRPSEYVVTKTENRYNTEHEEECEGEVIGNVYELFQDIDSLLGEDGHYTDIHTGRMKIKLGVPVVMDRANCDTDPYNECSYGLHVGSKKYVDQFGSRGSTILAVLFNPAHVIAVPKYDTSKMRVCEYFPYAVVEVDENRKLSEVSSYYFEEDYSTYEEDAITEALEKYHSIPEQFRTPEEKERVKLLSERLVIIE